MKLAALAVLALFAAPSFAQSAVDWSKPVIGVDSSVASKPKDEVKPVEVYTLQELNGPGVKPPAPERPQDVRVVREPDHPIASPPEPARDTATPAPCDPPVVKTNGKPAPAPCPAPPR